MVKEATSQSAIESVVTEKRLCIWLGQAMPGDVRRYHRGALALDLHAHSGRLSDEARRELAKLAGRATWASERGLVHLVQRRFGIDDYDYLVVACHRPKLHLVVGRSAERPERVPR
jgi:hypothetical protein